MPHCQGKTDIKAGSCVGYLGYYVYLRCKFNYKI